MSWVTIVAVLSAALWAYLVFARGSFWRTAVTRPPRWPERWPAVAAVVPARDEALTVGRAVASLLTQSYPGRFEVVVVDDHSSDGTAAARGAAASLKTEERLSVIAAEPLPPGWTGKLWALAQGIERTASEARYLLLTDADVEHDRDNLAGLVARAEAENLDLVSLMVKLTSESFAERALVPAFVFFFQMLYPFPWVNRRDNATAAAAGGCILLRREALARIGGIAAIRGRLIDDCALAAVVKAGGPIWLGLAERTRSLRRYPRFRDFWRVVTRTAYTQLRGSPILLVATILGLALAFIAPPAVTLFGAGATAQLGLLTWIAMAGAYFPTVRYYGLSPAWAPFLPLVALFYLAATVDSARLHWRGRGGEWKGRVRTRVDA